MTFHISSAPLTFDTIKTILRDGHRLALSGESERLILTCKHYLDRVIAAANRPLYGITTGFGSLCKITISPEDLSRLQANLVRSHACGQGAPVHPEITRLMLLLKIHALALGKSGVQLATVQRVIDMYNEGILPVVRELGSLGASGDLSPLAHLFLPLIGEGEVTRDGVTREAAAVLRELGWAPVTLQAKEGLALLNGTQFMSAHAVSALLKSFRLIEQADIIAALSLDAHDGRIEPFLPQVHAARPHPGQVETARHVRALLEGSGFQRVEKTHVQDPYSFRCIPQVHGATRDAVAHVAAVVEREINSVTDNPTIFVDDDLILSGGNFHGQPLALALDFLSIAIAELGSISERRTYRLISGQRKTPEFLVANSGLNSGFMIPQYAAAAIVSQNKQLCTPCSVDSIPSSNEQEDHVSMGGNAATKCVKVIDNVERVLAIELMNAAQAIDLQRPLRTSPYLEEFLAAFRRLVPFNSEDRVMYRDIDRAVEFLQQHDPATGPQ
ncbi:MAG: histidine ammonia-lyase [Odoribacteraceae bacterium]|jgi:histidine ammonia-lyase|nr:histidine ammonia-lyase [Odoribacteraceae bacterium]